MHEMALAQGVMEIVTAEAARQDFTGVRRVVLEVGPLSCVDAHALEFCFDAVSRDTVAAGAALDIETPPGRAHCFSCEADIEISARGEACPHCGSHQLVVTEGDALRIKHLEVV